MGFFVGKCKVTSYNRINVFRKMNGGYYPGGTKMFLKN